jgi:hypothetical protein
VNLVHAGVLGKINLPPAFGPAQFPDSLASRNADVPCHVDIIELAFTLDLVHTLSKDSRRPFSNLRDKGEAAWIPSQ